MRFSRVAHALAAVLKVYSFFLLIPLAATLYWDDPDTTPHFQAAQETFGVDVLTTTVAFLLSFLFVFLFGFVLSALARPSDDQLREREAFFIVGFGWLLCSLLGAIPFLLTNATRNPTVAGFESMSGITTTGFSALSGALEAYPASLHVWRGTLHLFGGLGLVVVAIAVIGRLTEGGAKLISSEMGAGGVTRLAPKLSQTAKSLVGVYFLLNLLTFAALWVALRHTATQDYGWKESAFHALVHAFGTIATGGMSTQTGSVQAFESPSVNAIIITGALAAGVSFVLYVRAAQAGLGFLFRNAEFRFYIFLIVAASFIVAGYLILQQEAHPRYAAAHAPFAVITTITTTGYTAFNMDALPDGAKLVLLLLMFSGGMVGSTAGGLKVARLQLFFTLTLRELQRLLHPQSVSVVKVSGRIFPEESLRRIVVFFFAYVTTFIAGALAFSILETGRFDFGTSLVASAATLGNVGYGFWGVSGGFTEATTSDGARLVGTLLMWLGRLEIFTVLLLFVPATYRD